MTIQPLLIPEANVLRDLGYPSFYRLLSPNTIFECMNAGYLNFLKSSTNSPESQSIREGDYLTIYPDSFPPFTVPTEFNPYAQSLYSGGAMGRVLYNAFTDDYSWIPTSPFLPGYSGISFQNMVVDLVPISSSSTYTYAVGGDRVLRGVGIAISDLGSSPVWDTVDSVTVAFSTGTGPLKTLNLEKTNLKFVNMATVSQFSTSGITVTMTPSGGSGVVINCYILTSLSPTQV